MRELKNEHHIGISLTAPFVKTFLVAIWYLLHNKGRVRRIDSLS